MRLSVRMTVGAVLLSAALAAGASQLASFTFDPPARPPSDGPRRKVLIFGIDGCRWDAVQAAQRGQDLAERHGRSPAAPGRGDGDGPDGNGDCDQNSAHGDYLNSALAKTSIIDCLAGGVRILLLANSSASGYDVLRTRSAAACKS